MDRAGLLKCIAQAGYNVGFGAKKHFATFDTVSKLPGWISFMTLSVGVGGLFIPQLSAKVPSAVLIIAGIGALFVSFYRGDEYDDAGKELTAIFTRLRNLYHSVQGGGNVAAGEAALFELEEQYRSACLSRQIFLSSWYAHYKFFAEQQIDWIDEQLHFTWRDRIPLSARFMAALLVIGLVASVVYLLA